MARRVEEELVGRAPGSPARATEVDTLDDLTAVEVLPILLVDDDTANLRTLEAVLAPLGFPLQTATSGAQALRLLLERDFALILLDVRMPGMDGLETARLIKGRTRTCDIPIVFLTALRDEAADIVRGYGVGAVDYMVKPFDPELLRSKVAVFAELESGRRALKRSEAFLRGAFEAAPIGKTVLDASRRIIRPNPAFARLLRRTPTELQGADVTDLCHRDDRELLRATLDRVTAGGLEPSAEVDLRLRSSVGSDVWVAAVASPIEATELGQSLLLVQWVDLTARRRAEQARAELLLEHSARTHAEAVAERLAKLQTLVSAIESLSLAELLPKLAVRLAELLHAEIAEVRVEDRVPEPVVVRVVGGRVVSPDEAQAPATVDLLQAPMQIEHTRVGVVGVAPSAGRDLTASERSLLFEAADRAALSIRRAQLHEEEHRIAVELQRGLLPKRLPEVPGIEIAAHYEAAGVGAQVGGDWYDAFPLRGGRIGVVVGDVAGKGIPAASMMGQLRSVTRGFALGDDQQRRPGEVLTRVNRYQLAIGSEELFTVLYAIVDPLGASISWASAGHPPPLLMTGAGTPRYLEQGGGLMGIEDVNYQDASEAFAKPATLILYTDGLIERRGESLDVGMKRLAQAAACGPDSSASMCEHILDRALPSKRHLDDDVTAVVVRIV